MIALVPDDVEAHPVVADGQFILRGTPGAFVAMLVAARDQGVTVTRTKLAMLLYIADLRAADSFSRSASGSRWRWLDEGPADPELLAIEGDLVRDGAVERVTSQTWTGEPEYDLRLTRAVSADIDAEFGALIEQTMHDCGNLAVPTLRDLVYQTEPMLRVQRQGSKGDGLDLLTGRSMPDIGSSSQGPRQVARQVEPQQNEGDLAGLADDINSWADYRVQATELLLSDE